MNSASDWRDAPLVIRRMYGAAHMRIARVQACHHGFGTPGSGAASKLAPDMAVSVA